MQTDPWKDTSAKNRLSRQTIKRTPRALVQLQVSGTSRYYIGMGVKASSGKCWVWAEYCCLGVDGGFQHSSERSAEIAELGMLGVAQPLLLGSANL